MMEEIRGILIEGFNPTKIEEETYDKDWKEIYSAFQNKLILQGTVTGIETLQNKVCAIVQFGHIRGVIPIDFSGVEDIRQLRKLTGQDVVFKVVSYDREGETFVASRKDALEHMAGLTWNRLEEGAVIIAVVREVTPIEVRADIGGIMVKIPIEEVDYGWIDDLEEKVKVGDHLHVKVVELDKENKKVKVSAKQAKKNPWPECTKRYQERGEYVGKVSGVREYGVFVNLEPNVDALCPHPRYQNVKKGDKVLMRVLHVDPKKEQIRGRIVRII
ncbi:S1 RNA-binding domain-containing protein [Thermicanus aegyptius]|uniref:S1 RNA-binding domain-containing protein n=1 Tax=Thermicanus aegyptius TaxID=94009 RepID=UPI0003FDA0C8|nr:S1 RNA-binding domain-containing protein [Thermicanus aegyptius]